MLGLGAHHSVEVIVILVTEATVTGRRALIRACQT